IEFHKMTVEDLDRMSALVQEITDIRNSIEEEKRFIDRELESALSEAGLENWELKGDEIRQLIDKFTIYIHKKKADTDGVLEVSDEGASSGDITLF
ncbi:MAG: hypothetical protein PQJ50_16960, partial [Spirochaetales bacterium]|nr:hypothetical protein [Spirochaetales bacterium]